MRDDVTDSIHANLDPKLRAAKAQKILRLLYGRVALKGAKVLEIGTGSGVIAQALKGSVGPTGEVWAVDIVDQRLDREGVGFRLVTGTALPFEDEAFDLVISNHVVEHVGDLERQDNHLGEIARVLRPGGWLYLATPNRFAPLEPHFKLPFLSWLPGGYRSTYVRAARRGPRYDCWPLTRRTLMQALARSIASSARRSRSKAIDAVLAVERPSGAVSEPCCAPPASSIPLPDRYFPHSSSWPALPP